MTRALKDAQREIFIGQLLSFNPSLSYPIYIIVPRIMRFARRKTVYSMHQHTSGRARSSKRNSLYRVGASTLPKNERVYSSQGLSLQRSKLPRRYLFGALTALIISSTPAQSAPLDYRHFAESAYRYADIAYASYTDAATRALELKNALFHFAAEPDANKLTETRAAWLAAIDAYSKTEAFRFPGGLMDDDQALSDKISHWPLDQAYLDYIQDIRDCGLINDVETYPKIDEDLLLTLHKKDGPNRITLAVCRTLRIESYR
jgi:hypothetical protein